VADTVRLTAAQALVRHLQVQFSERDGERRRVIPAMFGIPGHGNVCGIGQAVSECGHDLPFLQPKHEQSMVHTALGFAKATRRLATLACTASIGPGATNLVTGAATATTNRLPVMLLPGDTFATKRSGVVLQQLEHPGYGDWSVNECLRPVSRFFDRIARPEQLLTALPEALRVLLDPAESGAVTLALHQDTQGEAFDYPVAFFAPRTWAVARRPPAAAEVRAAVAILRAAERPLIIAGGGIAHSAAEAALAQLADAHAIPVAETSAGKGAYHGEWLAGGLGVNGTGAANALAAEADAVLCLGTRLSDFTTGSLTLFQAPGVRFIAVNVSAQDAHKLGALPVVGDARAALQALDPPLRGWSASAAWHERFHTAQGSWRETLAAHLRPGAALRTRDVLDALEAQMRPGDWVVAAAGSPPGDLLKLWNTPARTRVHIEFAFSCMGHEIPAGLGIRLAQPDGGEVYVVVGDGTYLMAAGELATLAQERLKTTIVLLVNGGFQSIRALQRTNGLPALATQFTHHADHAPLEVDFAANARSLGCEALDVDDVEGLAAALHTARSASGTTVIVCRVDPDAVAPASGAYWDLGVAESSAVEAVRAAATASADGRSRQRFFAWSGRS
jgi:3D-(3,5/4)-trihydroxycyclohexane-1,2-dione acylhydrolase (decyclizing)